ncbi:MAG: hypothetical protein ABSF77_05505 [Spirochaetia bacterium]
METRKEVGAGMEGKCNALLMADKIIREDNGKRGIIGSFNTFSFPIFPFTAPPFFVYANLEDFEGDHEFSVTIAREGAELVVFSAGGEIHFQDENREAEILVPAFGVTFPKEGSYNLILRIGNSLYGSRRITVNRMPTP